MTERNINPSPDTYSPLLPIRAEVNPRYYYIGDSAQAERACSFRALALSALNLTPLHAKRLSERGRGNARADIEPARRNPRSPTPEACRGGTPPHPLRRHRAIEGEERSATASPKGKNQEPADHSRRLLVIAMERTQLGSDRGRVLESLESPRHSQVAGTIFRV